MFLFLEVIQKCDKSDLLPTYANCMREIYGKFTVHEAARNGNLALVTHLYNQGNKINIEDSDGATPLVLAALENHWDVVIYLHNIICPTKKDCKCPKLPDTFRL